VSRALQDLTPDVCTIVDRRGKAVPLSGAGYVLHFGRAYRLHVVSPFPDGDLQEVCVVNVPAFLTVGPELRDVDEDGRSVRVLPLKVSTDWLSIWSLLRRFGLGVDADELEIVQRFKPGVFREAPPFLCPVIARPHWTVLFAFVFVGLLFVVVQKALDHALSLDPDRLGVFWHFLQRWDSWLWILGLAFSLWCLVSFLNLCFLYQRTRELRRHYREVYSA
jgi:hypothetical protein